MSASVSLASFSHMAAVVIGEGKAFFQSIRMSEKADLEKEGLFLIFLEMKEELALLNDIKTSTVFAFAGLFHVIKTVWRIFFRRINNRCCYEFNDIISSLYSYFEWPLWTNCCVINIGKSCRKFRNSGGTFVLR